MLILSDNIGITYFNCLIYYVYIYNKNWRRGVMSYDGLSYFYPESTETNRNA